MKNKEKLEAYLQDKNNNWDLFELPDGHNQRFLKKLEGEKITLTETQNRKENYKKYLQLAAVAIPILIVTLVGLRYWDSFSYTTKTTANHTETLSAYDANLMEAEQYFTFALEEKLEEIKLLETPENKPLVDDAMNRLQKLNNEYQELLVDLKESGGNPDVIKSILGNLQLKVEILEQLLEQIEHIRIFKKHKNETI